MIHSLHPRVTTSNLISPASLSNDDISKIYELWKCSAGTTLGNSPITLSATNIEDIYGGNCYLAVDPMVQYKGPARSSRVNIIVGSTMLGGVGLFLILASLCIGCSGLHFVGR